jgi:hypothetical protein
MGGLAYLAMAQLLVGTFALSPLAHDPVPPDGAEGVTAPFPLRFEASETALFHDIYFGMTPELGPEHLAIPLVPVVFWPGPWVSWPALEPLTTYYWRVDEVDADGTIHTGQTWSFTTAAWAAYAPSPADGATFVDPDADLSWSSDADVVGHDVYFGTDEQAVADGSGDTLQGRQEPTTFDPGPLPPLAMYYWRIDEITAEGAIRPGNVWTFTTVDYVVVDDFESYTNEPGQRVFEIWIDGAAPTPVPGQPSNGTNAYVGHDIWSPDSEHYQGTIMETVVVHGGSRAAPLYYFNEFAPHYSEVSLFWRMPEDFTDHGMNTLSFWFRGDAGNSREPLYVALEDFDGFSEAVHHPDPNALVGTEWQQWQVRLTTFSFGPADPTSVRRLYIGTGDRQDPQPGGEGIVYVDDVLLMRCAPLAGPNEPNVTVIDDFESYTNEPSQRMFETWYDGCGGWADWPSCTGAAVGHNIWDPDSPHYQSIIAEMTNVHGGSQAMPLYYNNDAAPYYSETYRLWTMLQDWTARESDALSLWFRGDAANSAQVFYVAPRDENDYPWDPVVVHPDPNAVLTADWQRWRIPLLTFLRNGTDVSAIKRLCIGLHDRTKGEPGGTGLVYIDDIELRRGVPLAEPCEPNVVVIDDFESYTNEVGQRVFETWLDDFSALLLLPPGSPLSSVRVTVGHDIWSPDSPYYQGTIVETANVHGGNQAMPFYYENSLPPFYSETRRMWETPQDWTAHGTNTLSLWFRGEGIEIAEPLYVAPEDNERRACVENHSDPNALLATEWQAWDIPLRTFKNNDVDITAITRLDIGVGDRSNPNVGFRGILYIDDIELTRRAPLVEPDEPNATVIDDFESYTNEVGQRMFETWWDACCPEWIVGAPMNSTGAFVGHDIWSPDSEHYDGSIAETEIVHGGNQAMPLYYDNAWAPYYSEIWRYWDPPQDWTASGTDTLSLWLRGEAANGAERFYVGANDRTGGHWEVSHPDPNALLRTEWQSWRIPLPTLAEDNVDVSTVRLMFIGIGNRSSPEPGGTGVVYIDDIELTCSAP